MKQAKQAHCRLDFKSSYPVASAALMALAFFLRMVYYFGLMNFAQLNFLEVIFGGIFPVIVSGAFVFLLGIRKLNVPGTYGLMGGALCVMIMLNGFFLDNILSILLSIVFYVAAGAAVLVTLGGKLRDKTLAPALLVILALGKLANLVLFSSGIGDWILGLSVISTMASLFVLILCLKEVKRRPQRMEE